MRAELSALPANRLIPDMGSVWSWRGGEREGERHRQTDRDREREGFRGRKYREQICYNQIQFGRLPQPRTPGPCECPVLAESHICFLHVLHSTPISLFFSVRSVPHVAGYRAFKSHENDNIQVHNDQSSLSFRLWLVVF